MGKSSPPFKDYIKHSSKSSQTNITQLSRNQSYVRVPSKNSDSNSYYVKVAAIINSRFQEVVFLDSDNVPLRDPAYLFESKEYQKTGAIFWPDFWQTQSDNPIWNLINQECITEFEQESGQMVIDKSRAIEGLLVTLYMNVRHDFFYKFLNYDKDTFRFGWRAINLPYSFIASVPLSAGYKLNDSQFCGFSMVQHDTEGEIIFIHQNLLKKRDEHKFPNNKRYTTLLKYSPPLHPSHKTHSYLSSKPSITTVNHEYELFNDPNYKDPRYCTRVKHGDRSGIVAVEFDEALPGFEEIFFSTEFEVDRRLVEEEREKSEEREKNEKSEKSKKASVQRNVYSREQEYKERMSTFFQ